MSNLRIRDKPHARIDRTLYEEVCDEAKTRNIKKTTMLESLIHAGLSFYRSGIAYELLIARYGVPSVDADIPIRNRPQTRIAASLYAEIIAEAQNRELLKTDLLELCVRIGLANLRLIATIDPQRVTPLTRSRKVKVA